MRRTEMEWRTDEEVTRTERIEDGKQRGWRMEDEVGEDKDIMKEEDGGGQRGWRSTRLERRRTGMDNEEAGV